MPPPAQAAPPAGLWVDPNDSLAIRVHNSLAGVALRVAGRMADHEWKITEFSHDLLPSSDRAANLFVRPAGMGYLLTLGVSVTAGAPVRGQTFCQIGLTRGGALAPFPNALLISDYLENNCHLGWPGGILRSPLDGPGVLRSITGTDPAAGVEISETVPTGVRWRLLAVAATLVASAAAANRVVTWRFDDGASTFFVASDNTNQTASQSLRHHLAGIGRGTVPITAIRSHEPYFTGHLLAGFRVNTVTVNLQAGDNWSAPQLLVEEWIQP